MLKKSEGILTIVVCNPKAASAAAAADPVAAKKEEAKPSMMVFFFGFYLCFVPEMSLLRLVVMMVKAFLYIYFHILLYSVTGRVRE